MSAVVNPVRRQTPRIIGRRHRRGILLVVPALLTAAITGSLSATLPPLSASEVGTSADVFTGTLAATLPPVAASLDGIAAPPPTILRLPPATPRILGRRHRRGVLFLSAPREFNQALDATLPPVALAASGTVANPAIYGQMDPRAPRGAEIRRRALAAGAAARGRQVVLSLQYAPLAVIPLTDLTATLPHLGLSASGTFVTPITGTLILSLPPLSSGVSSLVEITGTVAFDLPPLTSVLDGAVTDPVTGDLALTLPVLVMDGIGNVSGINGTLHLTLPPAAQADVGAVTAAFLGDLSLFLPSLAFDTYSPATRDGVLTLALPPLASDETGATASSTVDGSLAYTLAQLTQMLYAPALVTGDLVHNLPALLARLRETDFRSLVLTGVGDVTLVITGEGDGTIYLIRGVDP